MSKKDEQIKDTKSNSDYTKWYNEINSYERTYKRWEGRCEKIVKRYKDDQRYQSNPNARFNVLWSNVQVITPAIFARLPRPDVSRRFRDNDPVGRVASMLLERALDYELEHCSDYKTALSNAVQDRLLGGRGTAWVRYEGHFKSREAKQPEDGFEVTEDVEAGQVYDPAGPQHGNSMLKPVTQAQKDEQLEEELEYEKSPVDYVHYKDFGHSVSRTWEEVTCVWRKAYMNRDALVERFGEEIGYKIPLDTKPDDLNGKNYKSEDGNYQACIYEIWDKTQKKVIWLSKSLGRIIDTKDDPLNLDGFFPCPKPLYSTITTDSLEPIPDYTQYQDQARQLDTLADRIEGLINALRVRGLYDNAIPELQRLFSEGENNSMFPVQNWAAFAEKNGLKGAIDLVELTPFAEALNLAYQAMEQVKGQIYEIMGIADIQRGQTDPNETLGAQIIKSNNASGRLKTMQHNVVDFATKLLQYKAQIMCEFYSEETLMQISGANQLSDADKVYLGQALELLKNESSTGFRIEVTSDSMIYQDEQQEKADRVEFLSAVSQFINTSLPVAVQAPELTPLLMEMLKFGVTAFKCGKQLEGIIDDTADKFREQAKAMEGQPKPPPPEVQKLQIEAQIDQQKEQARMQFEQAKMQMEAQQAQQQAQLAAQTEQMKIQSEIELAKAQQEFQAQENQLKFQLEDQRNQRDSQMKLDLEMRKAEVQNNKDILVTYLNNASKIETARISAGLDDGTNAYVANVEQAKMIQATLGLQEVADYDMTIENNGQKIEQMMAQLMQAITQPKRIVRDEQGNIAGVVHGESPEQPTEGM